LRALVEYAECADISLNTAKTHLKQLFAKTETQRQTDLVRMFLSDTMQRLAASRPRA
jgi:DNA-binding CsgD family transcriptional regulator